MAAKGAYAKGVAKREEILRTALGVFARQGYRGTSLRDLADAVNLSQAGVLHYFGSKEELYAEVLRVRDEADQATFRVEGAEPESMVAVMRHNAEVPGLVRLYATLSTEAAEPDHPAHDFFVERYARFRKLFVDSVTSRQAAGDLDADLDPDRVASIALAVADGMQVQWLLDPSIDMADHIEYLWTIIDRLGKPATR